MRALTVLSGGVGGATFLRGLLHGIRRGELRGVDPDAEVTVIANTADDIWLHGLKICPDLDTVMYTLGDGIDAERGWGRRDETWSAKEELAAYGVEPTWFGLGDRDLATHLVRTQMLDAGFPLSEVTEALCRRWQPGVRLLPDDRRPRRDPHRHRRPRQPERSPGRALPGVLGPAARRGAGRGGARRSGSRTSTPGARRDRRDHRRRPRPRAAEQPGRLASARSWASPASARPWSRPGARSSGSPPSSAAPTCAAWPTRCSPPSASRSRPPASACTTAPASAGGVLDGWLVDTVDEGEVARVRDGRARLSRRATADDRPEATAAMAAAALDLVR